MRSSSSIPWFLVAFIAGAAFAVLLFAGSAVFAHPEAVDLPPPPLVTESPIDRDQLPLPPVPSPNSTPSTNIDALTIGDSLEGRAIRAIRIGSGSRLVILIAGLHGDEQNASALVQILSQRFQNKTLPTDLTLYFLAIANPDGYAQGSRLNANGVDLNRNWATSNWQAETFGPTGALSLGGGAQPFSEPETIALASWLMGLASDSPQSLTVIFYHSAFPPNGLVLPSYTIPRGNYRADSRASLYGVSYAYAVQSDFSETWDTYVITGEALLWCGENRFICLDIELPTKEPLSASEILDHEAALFALVVNTAP